MPSAVWHMQISMPAGLFVTIFVKPIVGSCVQLHPKTSLQCSSRSALVVLGHHRCMMQRACNPCKSTLCNLVQRQKHRYFLYPPLAWQVSSLITTWSSKAQLKEPLWHNTIIWTQCKASRRAQQMLRLMRSSANAILHFTWSKRQLTCDRKPLELGAVLSNVLQSSICDSSLTG